MAKKTHIKVRLVPESNQDSKVVCTFKRQILIPFEGYAVEDKIQNY